jgi:enamine deaminase RidA (YjgF/YER057c/UK114 family)
VKGPWEDIYGYRRVIRSGDRVITAGCTATVDGAVTGSTAADQARIAFGIALGALATEGAEPSDVIRTRMYITDRADADVVGRVHGEVFAAARPVSTLVIVAGLLDPAMLVEVEVEASAPSRPVVRLAT